MDKRIRKNELCIVGQPRCDFVFSSTRNCFIAYGFKESPLEMGILRNILEKNGIQPIEAGGLIAPGQNAFCAKICSKIITSQFCIVLLNNEENNGQEIPNANVNMEYGLILGFNKYVIPFQRESQHLSFNVSGLDTIKYTNADFEDKAEKIIKQAILETQQETTSSINYDQKLSLFLITKKAVITPITSTDEQSLCKLGELLGFNLLNSFSGMSYMFLGNFSMLRPEIVIWRIQMLWDIISERLKSAKERLGLGIITTQQSRLIETFAKKLRVWIIVNSNKDKITVKKSLSGNNVVSKTEIFSLEDIESVLNKLATKLHRNHSCIQKR
jgi:hypothetical protein